MGLSPRAWILTLALVALAGSGQAELWQWVDGGGGVRYTPDPSTIPATRRGSMVLVEPGMPMPELPPHSTIYAPADEYSAGADPFAAPGSALSGGRGGADPFGTSGDDPGFAYPPHLATRRAELLALMAQDEERIKVLISRDDPDSDPETVEPELREIARRLPALQAELRSVERAAAASRPR